MLDLSIITPSYRAQSLVHFLDNFNRQSHDGLGVECLIVQESDNGFHSFENLKVGLKARVLRQKVHHDCGAFARDRAILEAKGDYVAFWDDDNVYYPHAVVSTFLAAVGYDVGIVRVRHRDHFIPIGSQITAGEVDTMCLCVKRDLASRVKWVDEGGRYSDFRWITRIAKMTTSINYSKVVIGEHV